MIFNLGVAEILIILIVAYLILGPKGLPKIGRKAGKLVKTMSTETKVIHNEIKEIKDAIISEDIKSDKK